MEFFTKEEMIEAYGSKNKINLNGRTVYVSLCAPLTITTKSKENSKVLEDDRLTSPITEDSELKEKTSKRQRKGLPSFIAVLKTSTWSKYVFRHF